MKWTEGVFQIFWDPARTLAQNAHLGVVQDAGPGRRSTMGSFGSFVWSFVNKQICHCYWCCHEKSRTHPFSHHSACWQVVLQGLGQGFMSTILPAVVGGPQFSTLTHFSRWEVSFYLTHWVWVCFLLVNQFAFSEFWPGWVQTQKKPKFRKFPPGGHCHDHVDLGLWRRLFFWGFFHAPCRGVEVWAAWFWCWRSTHWFVTENTSVKRITSCGKDSRNVSHLLPPARDNVGKRLTQGFPRGLSMSDHL